jgi:REP element-mobilizing transposase RayT
MPRLPRLKISDRTVCYHVHNRLAGDLDSYLFKDNEEARRHFLEVVRRYTRAYVCDLVGSTVMDNHYHLVVRIHPRRPLSRKELERRAALLYDNPQQRPRSEAQWQRLQERLFDLSELMRNINGVFAQWYNRRYRRRGPLWADRFHSVLLADRESTVECLIYVELNPVRAGLVNKPEAWRHGSVFLRLHEPDPGLLPLAELFDVPPDQVQQAYWARLYERGAIAPKEGQGTIPAQQLRDMRQRGYYPPGVYLDSHPFFTRGVMIGAVESCVQDEIDRRDCARPGRQPVPQLNGQLFSLTRQRRPTQTEKETFQE